MDRSCSHNALKILAGTPLGRPWLGWEDNIRIDLNEIATNTRNWVNPLRIGTIGEPL